MHEKHPYNDAFDRKAAFSFEITNPDSPNEKDAIQFMATLEGSLICFSENSITNIRPAELIDPEELHPETRHNHQRLYAIGSKNSLVARSILQSKEILDSVLLRDRLCKQSLLDHIWGCTKFLLSCEKTHFGIYEDTMSLREKCDQIVGEGKRSQHIPSLPQVDELEEKVGSYLANAKRFIEKSYGLLCYFYGAPSLGSNFMGYRDWMKKNHPDKKEIITLLEQDKIWIRQLVRCRNAMDSNHAKPGYKVTVQNFRVVAGNKFSGPSWRYDFSGDHEPEKQDYDSDLIVDLHTHLENMLLFFEELFLICIKDNWDDRYNFKMYRREDTAMKSGCRIPYYVSMAEPTFIEKQ
jgi:hypothetical protein